MSSYYRSPVTRQGIFPPATLVFDPDLWREKETFVSKIRPLIPNLQDGLRNVFVTFPSIDAGTPSPITSSSINEALQRVWGDKITATRLYDWLEFYAVSAIFQPCNGGNYVKCDQFWNCEVSLAALTSLLFIGIQWNGLLRAKGVVILDTGHHLTSYPTNVKVQRKNTRNTVSNAHKMMPPAPPCYVWQSPCFALGNPQTIRIKT